MNVMIALLLFGWLQAAEDWEAVDQLSVTRGSFVERVTNTTVVRFACQIIWWRTTGLRMSRGAYFNVAPPQLEPAPAVQPKQ